MVTEITRQGLIVTTSARTSEPLEELAALCDWPVLVAANLRGVRHQLHSQQPECLLFWLEQPHGVGSTVQLIQQLRKREPRLFRVVVVYRLADEVEAVLRAAAVHLYLPAAGNLETMVRRTLWPWLDSQGVPAQASALMRRDSASAAGKPTHARESPSSARPP